MKLTAILFLSVILLSCAATNTARNSKNEDLKLQISERRNVINPEKLPAQQALSLDERLLVERGQSRGLLAPVAGSLVSMATDALKKMIANDQKKFTAAYTFGLTDLYFYDQLSNEGPFDPVGMQFSGFKMYRTFINDKGVTDTAFTADVILDTLNSSEMINNSIFRLRMKEFRLYHAKAKIPRSASNKLNMDIEVSFLTSYVNSEGMFFDNVVLGRFYFLVRNAPLDRNDPSYAGYYGKLTDSLLTGRSFLVPRSFGYHRAPDGLMKSGYSQGAYSIQVKITEGSKDRFVNKMLIDQTHLIINEAGNQIRSKINKKL